jgi:hypothetical protein
VTGNSSGTYQIGTLFFQNSDSTLQALIFGATINFYLGSVNPNAYLGSDSIIITTTSNIYGQPGGLTSGDDDYVNICGNNSQICGQSIEAVENSEGGAGLAVNLYGSFLGDPTLLLQSVSLAPGQNSAVNGAILTDPPLGELVPEPGVFGLTAAGLATAILACVRVRRR